MLLMFFHVTGVYQDIVYIDDKAIQVLTEDLIHIVLEDGWGVGQAIRHNPVLVVS